MSGLGGPPGAAEAGLFQRNAGHAFDSPRGPGDSFIAEDDNVFDDNDLDNAIQQYRSGNARRNIPNSMIARNESTSRNGNNNLNDHARKLNNNTATNNGCSVHSGPPNSGGGPTVEGNGVSPLRTQAAGNPGYEEQPHFWRPSAHGHESYQNPNVEVGGHDLGAAYDGGAHAPEYNGGGYARGYDSNERSSQHTPAQRHQFRQQYVTAGGGVLI